MIVNTKVNYEDIKMVLQLSAPDEVMHKPFRGGASGAMRKLTAEGREPGSVLDIVGRRMYPNLDVRRSSSRWFYTGDSGSTDETGDSVLTWDAQYLRDGNSVFTRDYMAELRASDKSLVLPRDEAHEAHDKGLIKRCGVWVGETPTNEMVAEFYFRGQDFQDYAEMVSRQSGRDRVLIQFFSRHAPEHPYIHSVVVGSIRNGSRIKGFEQQNYTDGVTIGVMSGATVTTPTLDEVLSVSKGHLSEDHFPAFKAAMEELYEG